MNILLLRSDPFINLTIRYSSCYPFDQTTNLSQIGTISAVPSNIQKLFGEKRTCVKFLIDVSKTEELVFIFRYRQTDMARTFVADTAQGIKLVLPVTYVGTLVQRLNYKYTCLQFSTSRCFCNVSSNLLQFSEIRKNFFFLDSYHQIMSCCFIK